jgi:hypothetical protein
MSIRILERRGEVLGGDFEMLRRLVAALGADRVASRAGRISRGHRARQCRRWYGSLRRGLQERDDERDQHTEQPWREGWDALRTRR